MELPRETRRHVLLHWASRASMEEKRAVGRALPRPRHTRAPTAWASQGPASSGKNSLSVPGLGMALGGTGAQTTSRELTRGRWRLGGGFTGLADRPGDLQGRQGKGDPATWGERARHSSQPRRGPPGGPQDTASCP